MHSGTKLSPAALVTSDRRLQREIKEEKMTCLIRLKRFSIHYYKNWNYKSMFQHFISRAIVISYMWKWNKTITFSRKEVII